MKSVAVLLFWLAFPALALDCAQQYEWIGTTSLLHLELKTPANARLLEREESQLNIAILDAIEPYIDSRGYPPTSKEYLQVAWAAKEAFKNAVKWGHGYDTTKPVTVEVRVLEDTAWVIVHDHANRPFDPLNAPGSKQPGESDSGFAQRRANEKKELTEGQFYNLVKEKAWGFRHDFEAGNQVVFRIPLK